MNNPTIIGTIAGDIIGSVYEFCPARQHDFRLFHDHSTYTDDSIMTIAVAEWLLNDHSHSSETLIWIMQKWGQRYPDPYGAYGSMFSHWLQEESPRPYNSWGNGSAMRVSAVGFACDDLEEVIKIAEITASVSHNHPEGIKGAQATAAAIFLARSGQTKAQIRYYIEKTFGYDLSRTCADLMTAGYHFEASCQKTVPESIITFLDSSDYEDAIRRAVYLGGDADTMGAITGGIAAAYYKVIPDDIAYTALKRLSEDLRSVVDRFNATFAKAG